MGAESSRDEQGRGDDPDMDGEPIGVQVSWEVELRMAAEEEEEEACLKFCAKEACRPMDDPIKRTAR